MRARVTSTEVRFVSLGEIADAFQAVRRREGDGVHRGQDVATTDAWGILTGEVARGWPHPEALAIAAGGERVRARAPGTSARGVMFMVPMWPLETLVDWARRVVTELRVSGGWWWLR